MRRYFFENLFFLKTSCTISSINNIPSTSKSPAFVIVSTSFLLIKDSITLNCFFTPESSLSFHLNSKGINGIRGILAIIIALFHFELIFPMTKKGIFRSGYIGVEFFFILSGFLLVKGFYDNKKCDIVEIIKSKIKKMYPAYVGALILLISVYVIKWYNYNYFAWLEQDTNASHFMAELFMLQGLGVSNFNEVLFFWL